jgi:hypothetical protein
VAVPLHVLPALAEQIAAADEERVPDSAADRGEDREPAERHPVGAGRNRHQAADHRRAPSEEHRAALVPVEPPVRGVQIVGVDQRDPVQPAAQPVLAERVAQPVQGQGADHRTGGRRAEDQRQADPALARQVPGQRQHDLTGDRRNQVLQRHQQGDAELAERLDDGRDPARQSVQLSEVRFRHRSCVPEVPAPNRMPPRTSFGGTPQGQVRAHE